MDYKIISQHYENCLEKNGTNYKGLDWPNFEDLQTRYKVMVDLFNFKSAKDNFSVLDLGCGYGEIIEFLKKNNLENKIDYYGIDLSEKMIESAKKKYPGKNFKCQDILLNPLPDNNFDYIIMNGLFTEKRELSYDYMWEFFQNFIETVFKSCKIGIAFNVMSHHVDWQRDDLFHLPFDELANFLCKKISRNFIFRADYKLYEYTTYVFK